MGQGQQRQHVLEKLAYLLLATHRPHPLRVAVDGPDAAGKTTLADELAGLLRPRRPVARVSVDDFLRPRAERYRRGRHSPEGCCHDAHDHATLCRLVLDPLGPEGTPGRRSYVRALRGADAGERPPAAVPCPDDAVLLVDGVYLQRPELAGVWDLRVYVAVDEDVVLARGVARDAAAVGGAEAAERLYWERYLPAQRLYARLADPLRRADAMVDNTDPRTPGCSAVADQPDQPRSRPGLYRDPGKQWRRPRARAGCARG